MFLSNSVIGYSIFRNWTIKNIPKKETWTFNLGRRDIVFSFFINYILLTLMASVSASICLATEIRAINFQHDLLTGYK